MKSQSRPLLVSLVAIAVLTAVAAATNHPAATPDPATTNAFEQLAQRAGGRVDNSIAPVSAGSDHAAVVAPPAPDNSADRWDGGTR